MYCRIALSALFAALTMTPALSNDACNELWFTRNLIFDRAGYCFSSPLGQAIFDNSDCTTREPVLSAQNREIVAWARETEIAWECKIDTNRRSLAVLAPTLRQQIEDIPIPIWGESGCSGWLGEAEPLFDRRSEDGLVVGFIHTGDDVYFAFENRDGWEFVANAYGDKPTALGWTRAFQETADWMKLCTGVAG